MSGFVRSVGEGLALYLSARREAFRVGEEKQACGLLFDYRIGLCQKYSQLYLSSNMKGMEEYYMRYKLIELLCELQFVLCV